MMDKVEFEDTHFDCITLSGEQYAFAQTTLWRDFRVGNPARKYNVIKFKMRQLKQSILCEQMYSSKHFEFRAEIKQNEISRMKMDIIRQLNTFVNDCDRTFRSPLANSDA